MATPGAEKRTADFVTHRVNRFEELIKPHHIHVDLGAGIEIFGGNRMNKLN